MRTLSLLIAGSMLASCTMAPPPPMPVAQPSAQLQQLLAGKSPRAPLSCLPPMRSGDMRVIDGRTLAFGSVGSSTVYVAHLTPGCEQLGGAAYTLLSRRFGGGSMCQGYMQQVLNTMSNMTVGSCAIADIVPFTRM
jgi:hypothetical protein